MNELQISNNTELKAVSFNKDLYNSWLNYLDSKPKTIETYTRAIRQFYKYLEENNITQPTRNDVINYRDYINASHKATTTASYLMAVKLFFQWLEQEGLYKDIAQHIKAPKIENSYKKDYLNAEQVKGLLASVDTTDIKGLRDYAILALMITTGLRDVEVMRANREDLGTVGGAKVLYIQGKGKDGKNNFVKLAKPVEETIKAYLKARGTKEASAPLFTSTAHRNNNARLTTRSISRIVKGRLIEAGLDSDRLTAHSLRHTAGTLNLRAGATLEETQQLLRHSNINTTMIYAHLLQREDNKSEERIASVIF